MLALLDRLGIERASLLRAVDRRHGRQWLAIHAPERIDRLVLCCTSAHLPPAAASSSAPPRSARRARPSAVADAVVGRWFTPAFAAAHPEIVAATGR